MSANILTSVHGMGAIQDTSKPFKIDFDHDKGYAVITPSSSKRGWLYFPLPAPSFGSTLRAANPVFKPDETSSARVTGIEVWQGPSRLLQADSITVASGPKSLDFQVTSNGTGLLGALFLDLSNDGSELHITSFGVNSGT